MPKKDSEIIDIDVVRHHATDKAYLVSKDGNRDSAVWIPKSEAELEQYPGKRVWKLTLPTWLAEDKELA